MSSFALNKEHTIIIIPIKLNQIVIFQLEGKYLISNVALFKLFGMLSNFINPFSLEILTLLPLI